MRSLIGQTLGGYQITREIGRGGMAVVYEADQTALGRRVAIKVLPPELTLDETFVQRFAQEARSAAALSHPNIVTIYDVGRYEGYYFIAMQMLDGEPLSELIRRAGRLPVERVLHILDQIASALDYAHGKGLVHRDIKPANIIVGPGDYATLTDFGIAKAAENSGLTRTGMLMGTPEYMSPEQASGQVVGPASDLYSLGIVIYQMLAGRAPFQSDSTPALLHQQVYEQPQPVRAHAPDLPKGVDPVLAKALAKDPAQRFSSADALACSMSEAFGFDLARGSRGARLTPPPPSGVPVSPPGSRPSGLAAGAAAFETPSSRVSGLPSTSQVAPAQAAGRPPGRRTRLYWIAGLIGGLGVALLVFGLSALLSLRNAAQPVGPTAAPTALPQAKTQPVVPAHATAAAPRVNLLRMSFDPGDVSTIDPALAADFPSIQIVEETAVGLTRQDELTSQTQPGMAERWEISPDGKVYTFHLRGDVPWVRNDGARVVKVQDCDGRDRMVTAHDFEYGILRTLNPDTDASHAFVLDQVLEGAAAYNDGQVTDPATVGVKALDDRTLQIKFVEPAAYNALIAGMWMARAQPKWVIEGDDCTEARGERWIEPGWFQSYGPYALKKWVHESSISLVKNPFWPGSDAIPRPRIEEIVWSMLDEEAALALYQTGELDSTAVPMSDLDRVRADAKLSAELVTSPTACTGYYGFNAKAPYVNDPRVRRALSMAIDRRRLIDDVFEGGQEPAQWFARPGLAGAPTLADHPDLGVKFDPVKANAELESYLKEKGLTRDQLDLTLSYNTGTTLQKIAEATQAMWKERLGLDVKLAEQEWDVYRAAIDDPKNTMQIFRMGWCRDYSDANNFHRDLSARGGSLNPSEGGGLNWQDSRYEDLVVQAAREMDPRKRVDLYAQAENLLVLGDAIVMPVYWYAHQTLTKPYVRRTYAVTEGQEHIEKWNVTP